jgi:putative hydrolase of the HAD superfamily
MKVTAQDVGYKWILLDADGVLQSAEQPFVAALRRIAGSAADAWLADTFRVDGPVITGKQEVLPVLAEFLHTVGAEADPREVYTRLWEGIHLHQDVLELVASWRGAGRRVALTTNQDLGRARFMRTGLRLDERFDRSFYSCDLGVAKPSVRFFDRVLTELQAQPEEAVFIDDSVANVSAARSLGIDAHRWQYGDSLRTFAECIGATPGNPGATSLA